MRRFPFFKQRDQMQCGPTCLQMIAKYYGKYITLERFASASGIERDGVSILGLSEAAETNGLRSIALRISFKLLSEEAQLPCIAHWNENHFIVVYKVSRRFVYIADPSSGLQKITVQDFITSWHGSDISEIAKSDRSGVVLLVEPTAAFYQIEESENNHGQIGFIYLYNYLLANRSLVFQLFGCLLLSSLIQLVFPFLTQAIVDVGIEANNINFIYLILVAQLALTLGRASTEFIKSWVLVHLSIRVNLSILSDFLAKLMTLPVKFFDQKVTGDILRRIEDHSRIERFLSSSTLNVLFSVFTLAVFGLILATYNVTIFLVMVFGSLFYVLYICLFLSARRQIDYRRFNSAALNQSSIIEIVQGMPEIKLNNNEKRKRWQWETIQAKLFHLNLSSIRLQQWQDAGSLLINESKNILITIISAQAVVNGQMTLGMMLSIQYIIGQLNSPVIGLVNFIREYQDAKISLERIGEIQTVESEYTEGTHQINIGRNIGNELGISLTNVFFRYGVSSSRPVLNGVNLLIPKNKVTAIVGMSGSGKTSILKLLLRFYDPSEGSISVDGKDLSHIPVDQWRSFCGVVMQDGFIFSDSIAHNITMGFDGANLDRLQNAVEIANLSQFVTDLPKGLSTKIGDGGVGISQGQRQRILIARAVYKDPGYLFFDEATSSLDAHNERDIMDKLTAFYSGRTVLIIAHRLSTVRNADKIVVLKEGKLAEEGCHEELVSLKGHYFQLVKNQLELAG